jgi:ribonucleoside-diphosphate reductase alpha chain
MSEIRWLNENSYDFLSKDYLLPKQTVENRISVIGDAAERILGVPGFSLKVRSYISKGWISPSTPIWSNFGTDRGLPISCFGSYCVDSISGILETVSEVGMMTKQGGGTSGYFGSLRGRGSVVRNNGISSGSKSFLELFQSVSKTIQQGGVRRGFFSAYIDIDHLDINEWLNIKAEGDPIQHITWGVCVPTWWFNQMKDGDLEKRKTWAKVIQKRFETGVPYIFFTDNANNEESTPECYKGKDMIKASNMCTEIFLPSNANESFVCDLCSINDLYYDEWKDTDCIEIATFLLDAAMTEFIEKASKIKFMERAVEFAKNHRALGIGRLGYHSLLQSKMIPFESMEARALNNLIQKTIKDQSYKASEKLAQLFGECTYTKGLGRRNTTTIAIAPTMSSSFIMGVSQSIEPYNSNYYTKDLAKGKFAIKNKYLEKVLESYGKNNDDVWRSIMDQDGSVLHLDFLSTIEKNVFKTAREISQREIIVQAAQRQKYIDQGQSLNLFVTADTTAKEVNEWMILAHDMGIKSLYYQHNVSAASEFAKQLSCVACE